MHVDTERLARLRELGLSEYASRAYLALLELGTTGARDVSRLAKVPVAKVYQTLDQLQAKGLVQIEPTTPKTYHPVPISTFVQKVKERHLQDAREMEALEPELSAMFPVVGTHRIRDRGTVRLLRERAETLQAVRAAAADAREDVLILASGGWARRPRQALAVVENAAEGGARVRVLLPHAKDALPRLGELRNLADVRERSLAREQGQAVATYVFDGSKVILAHHVPDDASTTMGKDIGVVIEEEAIAAAVAASVECEWASASPLDEATRRVPVGDAGARADATTRRKPT